MFGWRGRVGVISTVVVKRGPAEFYKIAPEGLDYIAVCLTKEKEKNTKTLEALIKELVAVGVNCIIYSCTGRVTREIHGTEEDLIKLIEDVSGRPATTTIRAASEAMQHLSIKKMLLSGHSDKASTDRLKKYFMSRGFEIPFSKTLSNVEARKREIAATMGIEKGGGIDFPDDLCYTQTISAFRQLPTEDAVDGIYLPCASWTTLKYLNLIEEHTEKPVISTHRSNFWWVCKTLKIKGPITGHGKLLESL